jgi:drug/metabolite transporter (DMT)-like permease
MDSFVFASVLVAAACHAGWNAAIKRALDPLAITTLIALGAGLVALALVPLVGVPERRSWLWLLTSVIIHLFYFAGLIESYRFGDMGQVYPIARGTAPLLTTIATTLIVGEELGLIGWAGIMLLSSGALLLSLRGSRSFEQFDAYSVGFALFTAVTICAYSVVDGIGGRLAGPGSAPAYTVWLFIGTAALVGLYAVARRGPDLLAQITPHWKTGLAGGLLSIVSYGIAIWAMTRAPIATVAALRETSVLFAALLAVVFLKEPLRASRIVATIIITMGLACIRFQ